MGGGERSGGLVGGGSMWGGGGSRWGDGGGGGTGSPYLPLPSI